MNAIIVAYDESDVSKRALERAVELAQASGAELVVTSVAPILEPASGRGAGGIDPADPPKKHVEELRQARAALEARGVNAHYQAAIGEPAEAIVELASSRGADMIVVGSRHVNTIQRLLGQSVSDSVAHRARCDVLIVH